MSNEINNFVPQNLESAAMTIQKYAEINNISPSMVLDMFNVGIFAFQMSGALPGDLEPPAIFHMK